MHAEGRAGRPTTSRKRQQLPVVNLIVRSAQESGRVKNANLLPARRTGPR